MNDFPVGASFARRLEDEEPGEWAKFQFYRDAGAKRTHKVVAEHFGVTTHYVSQISSTHKWGSRIAAYEEWQERRRMETISRLNSKIAAMEVLTSLKFQKGISLLVDRLLKRIETEPQFVLMPTELAMVMDIATKVARVGRGDAAMIAEMKGDANAELMSTLKQLAGKKPAKAVE